MFYQAIVPLRFDRANVLPNSRRSRTPRRRIAAGDPPEAIGLPNIGIPATWPQSARTHADFARRHLHN